MPRTNDNWERLVPAVIKKQQLWKLFRARSRSPTVDSHESDFSSISKLKNPAGLRFISDYKPVFELEDLLRAHAETELGKGTFGSVYAAELDNGTSIAVKRLKAVNIPEQDFKNNMEIVGDVKHENVAPLRAYYYSKDEKLMIYDYYSGRSVSALLHGENGEIRANVDWEVRLRIAIGAARGISHIHAQNGGKLVHGNVKASNIFLNSQQYGHVSDLGLASMIMTTFPQPSRCYAPEVKSTQDISQESDVYSFGLLLLELLTRKSPESVDLVELAYSVSGKEWDTKVFDGDLLLNPSIRGQILRVMGIGINCVVKSPETRPKMSAVVKMLEDTSMMTLGDQVSIQTERNRLVFLGDDNPTFDLEDLSRASAEPLGEVTHKVIVEEGIIVCVKRLKDVIVTYEEFQQHMEIIGRMGHENVSELKAYHYSEDEKLLVYDYYNQGSLSAMLRGHIPLDWDTRVKIALGAAKGIAHIHSRNLVHGNIRASNIFCDNQQYGIVSHAGLRKLVDPLTIFMTREIGTWQAMDVYGFGMVLLELLSGKPSMVTTNRRLSACAAYDPKIWSHGGVDEEMEYMMQTAMLCIDAESKNWPKMNDVVQMLEAIPDTRR